MSDFFDIENNYWLRKDGTLYSSAKDAIVSANDPDYLKWLAEDNEPWIFPVESTGEDSMIMVMDYLASYGLGEINKLKIQLDEIDKKYSVDSIRFACDLANGNAWAEKQWALHEQEASVIRAKIQALEKSWS